MRSELHVLLGTETSIPTWRPADLGNKVRPHEIVDEIIEDVTSKVYPRSVRGYFSKWRVAMVFITQIIFYGFPWMTWNGRQAVLFDLAARKFYIFGMVLWPQDVIYLTLLLIISALGLFLFTAIAGRLFCGYACPQTVYTEIFMWIEKRVEGDRVARLRLDASPMSWKKLRLKGTKHFFWVILAVWTGFTFVGYFSSIRGLGAEVVALTLGPWQWFWLAFYSFATWGNAGFMREQVCRYMCPYARFQSVMVDKDTLVVTYDYNRGEPRGGRSVKIDYQSAGLGACVDCSICVQVCPTGIDIRKGMQYMCIGCGACVDACNTVMDKVGYERGLIRYTSERGILEKLSIEKVRRSLYRPRVLIYSFLMLVLVSAFFGSLSIRSTLSVDVMRDRGLLGRVVAGDQIENIYSLQFINKTESPITVSLGVEGFPGAHVILSGQSGNQENSSELVIAGASNRLVPVVVRAPANSAQPGSHPIKFVTRQVDLESASDKQIIEASSFYVPKQ